MLFFVHGRDGADVQDRLEELSEAHWAYLDGYADRLLARGPTLTPDGVTHTGSVHVLDLADHVAAQQFAWLEPFAAAGLYDEVTVTRFVSLTDHSMFDQPFTGGPGGSSLVVAGWPAAPSRPDEVARLGRTAAELAGGPWPFLGLLVTADASRWVGLAGALDRPPEEAGPVAAELVRSAGPAEAHLTVSRWQRGGRPG